MNKNQICIKQKLLKLLSIRQKELVTKFNIIVVTDEIMFWIFLTLAMAQIMIHDDTDSNKCNEGNKWAMKDFHIEIFKSQMVKTHTNLLVHFSIKLHLWTRICYEPENRSIENTKLEKTKLLWQQKDLICVVLFQMKTEVNMFWIKFSVFQSISILHACHSYYSIYMVFKFYSFLTRTIRL